VRKLMRLVARTLAALVGLAGAATVVGTQRPRTVRLRHEGTFQLEGRGWLPYRAEQHFTTDPPGFCGRRGSGSPLVSVVGRKQYRGGQASMQLRVLALVPVANKAGGGLNQEDLLRYLGSDFKATLVDCWPTSTGWSRCTLPWSARCCWASSAAITDGSVLGPTGGTRPRSAAAPAWCMTVSPSTTWARGRRCWSCPTPKAWFALPRPTARWRRCWSASLDRAAGGAL
jgi:hypothetical protein